MTNPKTLRKRATKQRGLSEPQSTNELKLPYKIGQTVYLRTDEQQKPYLVTVLLLRSSHVKYGLTNCIEESFHFDFEIDERKRL